MSEQLRILIVEDNPGDTDFIQEMLPVTGSVSFQVESVSRLSEAITRLKSKGIDLVLLDLGLPDSQGLQTFHKLQEEVPGVPVVVLTGTDNHEMAVRAVRDGAQDYLVKGQLQGHLLVLAARYALERKRTEEALRRQTEELRARNQELTRFNSATVARELRMIELKQEVNELCRRLGEPPRYVVNLPRDGRVPSAAPDPVPPGGGGS